MKIKCKICNKNVGDGAMDNGKHVCTRCYQLAQLRKNLLLGTNTNTDNLGPNDKQAVQDIIKDTMLDIPDGLFEFRFSPNIQTAKEDVEKAINIEDIKDKPNRKAHQLKSDILKEAKKQGLKIEDLTKAKIKPIKDNIINA